MKKRFLSAMLASALLVSMAVPGISAESGDSGARLAAVTEKVKDTLGLDTQQYADFNGQLTEGELTPTWQLSWSGEDGSLEVMASESGRILSCYRYTNEESRDRAPLSLPRSDPARARAAAEAFLNRVLDGGESVDLDAAADPSVSLGQTRYYFRGAILLNGCPSPLSFSLAVRASDYAVVQFRRDALETDYIGSLPAASFVTGQNAAEALLRSTLSLRLEYVLDEESQESRAVLRYLPNSVHSFYVDDASGKLVDLTLLYEELGRGGSAESGGAEEDVPSASVTDSSNGLTQAEQLGADKLKGTLDKQSLDRKARAISPLGLDSYALVSASYREDTSDEDAPVIIARLSYAKRVEEETFRRMVTLDAKTGALLSVSSSRPWNEEKPAVTEDAARKTAEAFLTAQRGQRFGLCALYTGDPGYAEENGRWGTWSFQYARQEKGYFFPQDQFTVGIDAADGSISSYAQSWTEAVQFDSPQGIVSMDRAAGAYYDAFQLTKGYVAVPQKLDLSDPEYAPLAEMGYRALNCLKLGWQLTAPEKRVLGIDAKTGRPVFWDSGSGDGVTYSDLAGSPAKSAAEALAKYGIGFAGGKLLPNKQLTQLELMSLLASTQGTLVDPADLEDDAGRIYRIAYSMGALRREERDDSKLMSRLDVIKCLLDAGGYGPAARLQGIYRTDFSDQGDIPENLLGYAALAQAIGVVQGERFSPAATATREDAILMLFAFMQRA